MVRQVNTFIPPVQTLNQSGTTSQIVPSNDSDALTRHLEVLAEVENTLDFKRQAIQRMIRHDLDTFDRQISNCEILIATLRLVPAQDYNDSRFGFNLHNRFIPSNALGFFITIRSTRNTVVAATSDLMSSVALYYLEGGKDQPEHLKRLKRGAIADFGKGCTSIFFRSRAFKWWNPLTYLSWNDRNGQQQAISKLERHKAKLLAARERFIERNRTALLK